MNIPIRMIMYDFCYALADALFKTFDPCKIHTDDGKIMCYDSMGHCCHGHCDHKGPDGCTVKCLACKLYFCYSGTKERREFYRRLAPIKVATFPFGLQFMRKSRDYARSHLEWQKKRLSEGVRKEVNVRHYACGCPTR